MTRGKPRGIGWHNARLTHCHRGHPFDEPNTRIRVDALGGRHRECRQCRNDRRRDGRARQKRGLSATDAADRTAPGVVGHG